VTNPIVPAVNAEQSGQPAPQATQDIPLGVIPPVQTPAAMKYGNFDNPEKLLEAYKGLENKYHSTAQELSLANMTLQMLQSLPPTMVAAPAATPGASIAPTVVTMPNVVQEITQRMAPIKQEADRVEILRRHPEWADPTFKANVQAWMATLPQSTAAAGTTLDGADDLLKRYKAANVQSITKPVPVMEGQVAVVSREPSKGPIVSAAKISWLRVNRPEEYEARQPEIMQAYQENRVR
jgi:hypothetical protein